MGFSRGLCQEILGVYMLLLLIAVVVFKHGNSILTVSGTWTVLNSCYLPPCQGFWLLVSLPGIRLGPLAPFAHLPSTQLKAGRAASSCLHTVYQGRPRKAEVLAALAIPLSLKPTTDITLHL